MSLKCSLCSELGTQPHSIFPETYEVAPYIGFSPKQTLRLKLGCFIWGVVPGSMVIVWGSETERRKMDMGGHECADYRVGIWGSSPVGTL